MSIQSWTLTNGDTIYVERTAVEQAREKRYSETYLYVALNKRYSVDEFYNVVHDILEESEAIEIFTSTIVFEGQTFDPAMLAAIEPRNGGTNSRLIMRSSRKVNLDATPLETAEAFGYVA